MLSPATSRLRIVAARLLAFVAAWLAVSSARAVNQYFDTSSASNLTAGTATWDVGATAAWAATTTPGATAPVVWANGNDAFFQTAGANTVTISGTVIANTLTQTTNGTVTTISGGTLQLGTTLTNSGNSALTINSALTLSNTLTVTATSAVTLGGNISGAFALTKAGASALTLTGTNSYTGTTTASAGTLRLGGATNAGLGTGTLAIGNGGTVLNNDATARTATNTLQVGNANVGDAGVFTVGASGDLTFGALTLETLNQRTLTVSNTVTTITGNLTHGNRFLTKAGTGALVVRGTTDAVAGAGMAINSGMLAVAGVGGGMNASEELKLNGGVFATNGTFSRALGTGSAQFQWAARDETGNATASGGFAAYGLNATWGNAANNLAVNIGGASAAMTWASTGNFVSGGTLMLGHSFSNGTVTFQNPLNLNFRPRTVDVARSSVSGAATDAALAGTVSNGILVKTGLGTLALTASSNTLGRISVNQGTLSLTAASIADTADIWLTTGATLDLAHGSTDTIDQLVINNVVQATGTWGSLASAATNKTALITGTGLLLVSSNAAATEAPIVENLAATAVTTLTATLNATLITNGLVSPNVKIYYGTTDGGTNPASWQNFTDLGALTTTGSATVSGLLPFTQYYFRAFAQNAVGSDWADATATFTTLLAFHLTETLPVNTTGKKDEDGTVQPWIELWNPDRVNKFSLSGYKLVHGATQWTFPAVEIMPDERMVIFASTKNRTVATSWLHTNFALSAAGGTLSMVQAGGAVDSTLTYPALAANVSYGRDFAQLTATGSYDSPTPGDGNNYSGTGVSGKVLVSLSSRAFTGSLAVTLTEEVPAAGAVIRYTLDGSVPISTSLGYSTALSISTTSLLRTRIFEPGKLPGETETTGYLLLDGTTSGFNTAAPIVVVSNFGLGTLPDAVDQSVFMWVWEPSALDGRARLSNLPTLASRGAADRRGSSTLTNAKTNFNFEARKARDDDDNDIPLLGMPDGSDWVFHAPFNYDRSDLHNPFFYALSNSIGRDAMRTRMAEVFVETSGGSLNFTGAASGDYYGAYNVMEKIRRGKERVDVTKLDTYDNDAVGKTGGFIWKVDRLDAGDTGFSAGGQTMAYYYPKENAAKSPQRDPQEQYLTSYIASFKTALDSATYTNPITGYAAWLDVGEAVDHHLMNVWTFNVDGLRLSGFLHKERGGKIAFGPVWDVDRGLSSTDGRDANPATWRSQTGDLGTDFFNYIWWVRLFTDADFYQRYIDRWVELRRGAFSAASVNTLLDTLNAELTAEAVTRDLARWAQTKRAWTSPFTGTVYAASQDAEVQRIKDFLQQRANFFESQWVAPVTFSHSSQNISSLSLSISGPTGATIYYTLDGTDPRPSGGAAPGGGNVFVYSTPLAISSTTRVKARAYNASWLSNAAVIIGANNPPLRSAWSGPTEARFSADTLAASGNLAITEINYHPTAPTAAELAVNPVFDTSDFEFIEVKNIGATSVDLGGIKLELVAEFTLTNAQGITLAPGAFAILAANPQAFSTRYPGVPNVLGPFVGDLDNGGERVVLKNASGAIIADFTYDDAWYPTTDGGGRTLAIYNPTGPSSTAANWRASAALGGSPGANEPNLAPTISAGADITAYLPSTPLAGSVDDDTLPAALNSAWSKVNGPGAVTFTAPAAPATTATFELPGTFTLRLTASDTALSAQDDVSVTMRDTPGAWLLRNPGLGTLNDDPDGDGRTNWFEWALAQNPFSGTGGDGTLTALDAGHLTLTYTRQKSSPFVNYTVQVAGNLAAWADPLPGDITETVLADDGITQTIRATDNAPAGETRFIRLKVTP